ncbi:MAG: hypothetical protein LUC90_07430 [Lachnospiraceae bacterium]|nr:hypothetical protein [Lachnospiraceae bacterium]
MDRREESEQDLHEKKEHSAAETAALVILLVLLFAALCVLVWQLRGSFFQKGNSDTLEVTEITGEEEESPESAGEPSEEESEELSENGESGEGSESENANSSGEDSQASSSTGEAETGTGQAGSSGEAEAGTGQAGSSGEAEAGTGQREGSGDGQRESGSTEGENSQTGGQSTGTTNSEGSMTFTAVDETVTAKSATNLRSEPSTSGTDTVVTVLESGMQAQRTGINEDTGWSRLSYEGQTLYAVSSLLTTDLSGQTTGEVAADPDRVTTQDGRVIIFTACDDTVSPKMSTNLRTEPSTSQGNNTVYYELQYGETVHRTGYDADAGWSRVEYDGQILYAVTSYLYVVE